MNKTGYFVTCALCGSPDVEFDYKNTTHDNESKETRTPVKCLQCETEKRVLISQALEEAEKKLAALNDFAENEGHPNKHVMFAVCEKIGRLEEEIREWKALLSQ